MFASSGDKGPPCGDPSSVLQCTPFLHNPTFQVFLNQIGYTLVLDLFAQKVHKQFMVQCVKVLGEVDFYRVAVTLLCILFYLANGLLCAPPGAVAVAPLRKERLKQRLQLLGNRLLDDPVYDRRDAKFSNSTPIGFGNFLAPYRAWLVPAFPDTLQKPVLMSAMAAHLLRSCRRFLALHGCV